MCKTYQNPQAELFQLKMPNDLLREFSIDGDFEGISLDEETYG